MLYLIGLGLDEKDISLKALEALKGCEAVYCEFYTSKWNGDIDNIEKLLGKKIKVLEREEIESEFLVKEARNKDVSLLIPGDPLTATTHFQLILDAKESGVNVEIVHAPSIYTAIAETGLQIYKFGRTTTLVKDFAASSPYDVIKENRKNDLHSLVLMDIEMPAKDGIGLLIKNKAIAENEKILACGHLGTKKSKIVYGPANKINIDEVPSIVIIPGKLNFKEEEALELWK